MGDPNLSGGHFDGDSWAAWRTVLAGLFGLEMDCKARKFWKCHTGRKPPSEPVREAWLIAGRRAGKSRVGALLAVYLAALRDHRQILAAGERATVMLLAADRNQARVLFQYVSALLNGSELLRSMVETELKSSIELTNGARIEIHTSSFRSVRGYSIAAAILDEVGFWWDETTANPATEVIHAVRPGMASVPGSMLIATSTPYSRKGALYDAYRKYYGASGDIVVWKSGTRDLNPTIPQRTIDEALADLIEMDRVLVVLFREREPRRSWRRK